MTSLTEQGCLDRQKKLWSLLPSTISWALICNPRHVTYFSGFSTKPQSYSAAYSPWLLLMRPRTSIILGDKTTLAANEGSYFYSEKVEYDWYDKVKSASNRNRANLTAFRSLIDRIKDQHGATEGDAFPLSGIQLLSLANLIKRDLGDSIRKIRRSKEPDEVELLKACARAGEAGHRAAFDAVKPGATELDVYIAVQEAAMREAGRPCIVYGDFRGSTPSNPLGGGGPTLDVLEEGGLFILDYSVVLNGYRLDFTNTIAIGGSPSDSQISAMVACKMALQEGEKLIRPGTPCKKIFAKVSEVLEIAGFGGLVSHAGHGLGLAHPESPTITSESSDMLVAGDVIALEPGIYKEGIGGLRIERNYLVTDSGFETLTHHPIELVQGEG